MKRITTPIPPRTPPFPAELPAPLPRALLPGLLERRRLLLCLDYDGTLSEITANPAQARPVLFATRLLGLLAAHPERLEIAIVSGREIDTLRGLLGLESAVTLVGSHGLETIGRDGRRALAPGVERCAPEIDAVRRWMRREAPARAGFVIEDKRAAIALHYRTAAPSDATRVRGALADFLAERCPELEIMAGKMVAEVIPRGAPGKGAAVRRLLDSTAALGVYFGDDVTDEDAFYELAGAGITVRVGAPQRSWARYRVDRPADVVAILGDLVSVLEPPNRKG